MATYKLVPGGDARCDCFDHYIAGKASVDVSAVIEAVAEMLADKSGRKCELCGDSGYDRELELQAHEIFSYDYVKGVRKVERVICVCGECHEVLHMFDQSGFCFSDLTVEHLMRVNGISEERAFYLINVSSDSCRRINQSEWSDYSDLLSDGASSATDG